MMGRTKSRLLPACFSVLLLLGLGCSGSQGPSGPELDLESAIALEGGSQLVFQDGGSLGAHHGAIEVEIRNAVAAVRPLLPFDNVSIVVNTDSRRIIPEIAMGGFAEANRIFLAFDPVAPGLSESIARELLPLLAHEMHHVARIRSVGYGNHLLGAMVTEGLADHFSVEVAGGEPRIWSLALTGDELALWSERSRADWYNTGYDRNGWFFGASPPIPRWAGYAIGFDLVGQFLDANPSRRASELYAEPADTFATPAP